MATRRRSIALAVMALLGAAAVACRRAPTEAQLEAKAEPPATLPNDPASAALRVCHLLQGTPAERRAACCQSPKPSHFEAECVHALTESLTAGRLGIDEAQLTSCSEATEQALTGCDWVTPSQPVPPMACQQVTRARVAEGSTCMSSLECVAPLHCEGNSMTTPGRCTAPLPDGSACRLPIDELGSYLFAYNLQRARPACAGACSLASHRCEDAASVECSVDRDCGRGQRCHEQHCVGPIISAPKQPGEACQTDLDCRLGGCSGSPSVCGMKCAASPGDRQKVKASPAVALPRPLPEPH